MQLPLFEWMAVRLRMSGKSVSGTLSTTPQMKSKQSGQNTQLREPQSLCEPVCSPSIVKPRAFLVHE